MQQQTPNFAELPDSIRGIMKSSIEQARKAFDSFVSTSENMLHGLDTSSNPVADSLKTLNEKVASFTKQNAEANFNLAIRLADARQLSDIVELQNAHMREQMETLQPPVGGASRTDRKDPQGRLTLPGAPGQAG